MVGCATAFAAAAFGFQWLGLQPVVLVAIVLMTWFVVAVRRVDLLLAGSAVALGWPAVVFTVLSITPLVRWDPRTTTSCVLLASLVVALVLVTRVAPVRTVRSIASPLVASLSGGALWLTGLALGTIRPGGGGLSWAMYRDSTLDIWLMVQLLDYHGIGSLGAMQTIQPLAYGMSTSMVLPSAGWYASSENASALLEAHAYSWTVQIVLVSVLAGFAAWGMARRSSNSAHARWPALAACAIASLGMVLEPVLGVAFDLGQTNVTTALMLLLAGVCAAITGQAHHALALSLLLVSLGLLAATWLPFAAMPVALAVPVARGLRRSRTTREEALRWLLPGIAVAAWALVVFGGATLRTALSDAGSGADSRVLATVTTFSRPGYWDSYTNPYWLPLAIALGTAVVLTAVGLARIDTWRSSVLALSVVGLVAGALPFVIALRGWPEQPAYYPAKYVFVACICLVPLVLGGCALLATSGRVRVWLASGIVCVLAFAAIAAPAEGVSKSMPTPWRVVQGERYGTHDAVAGRFIEYASSDVLKLPWRLDPPHDTAVALMMSSLGPDLNVLVLDHSRAVLRTYRNDFRVGVACQLAAAETRPLELVTADPTLATKIQESCPERDITVTRVRTP
jgi:hypothetical protein